jgi:protein-S-isoprenylcysteine O-methyltransferase Ste14
MTRKHLLRPAIVTAGILLIPLVMTILDRGKPPGDGWHWGPGDFVVMGALLFGAGVTYEVLASRIDRKAGKIAAGIAILLAVLAIWVELAVDGVSKGIRMIFGV